MRRRRRVRIGQPADAGRYCRQNREFSRCRRRRSSFFASVAARRTAVSAAVSFFARFTTIYNDRTSAYRQAHALASRRTHAAFGQPQADFGRSAKGRGPFNSFLRREELRETPLMDAVIKKIMPQSAYMDKPVTDRPTEAEVEAAVRTLLRWTGDNPDREGPDRHAEARRQGLSRNVQRLRHVPGRGARPHLRGSRRLRRPGHRQATSSSTRIASTTWCRSSARRMSAICRTARWSACRRSRAWSTSSPTACRRRKR